MLCLISACQPDELTTSLVTCESAWSYTDHPRNLRYQSLLDKFISKGMTGVNVIIDRSGDAIWAGTAGVSSIENNTQMELCNIMPLASVGKMYCGIAVMQMVEEGIIELDVTINNYLPKGLIDKVPNSRVADIANLLSHTSGIPDYADNPNLMLDYLNNNKMDFSRDAILERYVYGKKPKFNPGVEYSYSNSNYEILTIIMENVLGYDHADRYSDNIFGPLGLTRTYYKNETNYGDLYDLGMASGYFDRHSDGRLENATNMSINICKGQTGSDGVVSDVHDLHTFMRGIFNADLVSENTLDQIKEYIKARENFITYKYGLGVDFRDDEKNFGHGISIGHSGSLPGYATEAWYFPSLDTYIIFSSNSGNILTGPISDLIEGFRKELYDEVFN